MKILNILFIIFLISHASPSKAQNIHVKKTRSLEAKSLNSLMIGVQIQGNFKRDGNIITATAIQTKTAKGNPVEDGTPAEYEIHFSNKTIKSIKTGCCVLRLINEGDLNNDGSDEISLFQAPMNGCTYSMTTYYLQNNIWKQIVKTFLIPTACDKYSNEDLQKKIFKEDGIIYFLEKDMSDEKGKIIKKKAFSK